MKQLLSKKTYSFLTLLMICLIFSSCSSTYHLANATDKLVKLRINLEGISAKKYDDEASTRKAMHQISHIVSLNGDIKFGKLEISGVSGGYRDLVAPCFNICSATVLQLCGLPWNAGNICLNEFYFKIYDDRGALYKQYGPYEVKKNYASYMWGQIGLDRTQAIYDASRKVLGDFQKDLKNDNINIINAELSNIYWKNHNPALAQDITPPETKPQGNEKQQGEKTYSIEELQALGQLLGNAGNTNQQSEQPTENEASKSETPERILSDVDENIPVTDSREENTFVLIIANENYKFVDRVPYAKNDGSVFREYCIKTLGIPDNHVFFYEDATQGVMKAGINKMIKAMGMFEKSNAIIYYCGHGIPDEKTADAYIIPTDGIGKDMTTCYSLNTLYKTIGETNAENVTYFMDACFSGTNKDGTMLVAARGVAREPKKETVSGNTVVFSAASGDETAMAYEEKQHGLFTYYLLKKLQESNGNADYGELADYIRMNVTQQSFLENEKEQTPEVSTSPAVQDTWRTMRLK